MLKIKKLITSLLGSQLMGSMLLRLGGGRIRSNGLSFAFDDSHTFSRTAARIFFGFYESAERRMLKKHLPRNLDVIELGGSIGYISSLIQKLLEDEKKHVILEPDPKLAEIAKNNLQLNPRQTNFVVLNHAYSTPGRALKFQSGSSNVSGRLIAAECEEDKSSSRALLSLIDEYSIKDFSLVMDIEGAEVMMVKDEPHALSNCKCIIAELHATIFENDQIKIEKLECCFLDLGFERIDRDGNVFVFKRSTKG